MICFPNAKLNLGLNIINKRPDGYHNLETIFYPIPLRDALEIVPASAFAYGEYGIPIDADPEKNLVVKALRLLEKAYSLPPFAIYLKKVIPFGAGLGGGSSDAAHMLKLVNNFAGLHLSGEQLEAYATQLGADCSFFIRNKPVFASGIGNIFEPVECNLQGIHLCLVKPCVAVSTKEAYEWVKPGTSALSLKEIIRRPLAEWKELMRNDFEESVFKNYPSIREIKEKLYKEGAVYATMSGSGSSVFGLFGQPTQLKGRFPSCYVWEGVLS